MLNSLDSKVLEIRDENTHIPALAIKMKAKTLTQAYYIHDCCGYPFSGDSIMLVCLSDGRTTNDPYEWASLKMGPRTMPVAHIYILEHFDDLSDGDVIDVSFILGETNKCKVSERFNANAT